MKLLALVIAYAVSHFVKQSEKYKPYSWLERWELFFLGRTPFESRELNALLVVFIPILAAMFLIHMFIDSDLGFFLVTVAILFYCIGPKDLKEEVDNGSFTTTYNVNEKEPGSLIQKMTKVARQRWFGVLFWYVVLNIPGALIYRFTERCCQFQKPSENKGVYIRLINILNYPVSWMMVLALAIASDFDKVWKKSKSFFSSDEMQKLNDGFIFDSMSFAVKNCEINNDQHESMEQLTFHTLQRMLVVWLVIISVLVIFDLL